jgi:hypothetical protein
VVVANTVEEYGAHTASTTDMAKSNDKIGVTILESHIFTVQSAEAEIKVLG